MELRTVMIFVKDLPRMTAFYHDALGLRLLPDKSTDAWAEFDAGGTALALHAIPAAYAASIEIADPPQAREDNPTKLIFYTADLTAAREHLVSHGAVMGDIRSWGACDGLDPEGNVFQIAQSNESR